MIFSNIFYNRIRSSIFRGDDNNMMNISAK